MCVCVCVCVLAGDRQNRRQRMSMGEEGKVCVCVCVLREDRQNERTFRREKEVKLCVSVCARVRACVHVCVVGVLREDKQNRTNVSKSEGGKEKCVYVTRRQTEQNERQRSVCV